MNYNFEGLDSKQKTYVVDILLKQYKTALKREEFFSSEKSEDYENADERLSYYNTITNEIYQILKIMCPKNKEFIKLNEKYEVVEEE